jgi:hypothetical protein
VGQPPRGYRPRVAHRALDGSWDLKRARLTRAGRLLVVTQTFSINVPSWLNPKRWVSNLKQWAGNAGRWVVSGVAGRTPPLERCGRSAPDWFRIDKRSDLVHTCTIDNAGRGEIQIKSNRGISAEVRIPGNPSYVWVEEQPTPLRRLLPYDSDRRVILGPGKRMTVGYDRPARDFDGTFSVYQDTGWAQLDNVLRAVLDQVGTALPIDAAVMFTWVKCGSGARLSITDEWLSGPELSKVVKCMVETLTVLATDPQTAIKAVQELGGGHLDAAELVERAKKAIVVGRLIEMYPLIQATAIHDIEDSMRALLKGGNDQIRLNMSGGGESSLAPPRQAPVTPPVDPPVTLPGRPTVVPPAPPLPSPKPYAGNLRVVVYGGGHVGVAFDVGWQAGRDPVICHFFRDGVEVFTAQCGTYSSKQFYGVPAGTHTWHATVSDRFGVYSDPTNTVVRYSD